MIVPTLRVGMHPRTLRVASRIALDAERPGGITTRSVGTIRTFEFALDRH